MVADREHAAMTYLLLARRSRREGAKRRYAKLGLERTQEDETRLLLLAELFRSYFARGEFAEALETAERMAEVGVLEDGAHARAAAAAQALGDDLAAEAHLRSAVRTAPGERRSYHEWALGTFLLGAGRPRAAVRAFDRARELEPRAPLYRASAAAARCALGEPPDDLEQAIRSLERSASREGHGRYVLGLLYRARGDDETARKHLAAFLRRCEVDPAWRGVTLQREMAVARAALDRPPLARTSRRTRRVAGIAPQKRRSAR